VARAEILRGYVVDDNLRDDCVGAIAGALRALDTQWCDLVAGDRCRVRDDLHALRGGVAAVDEGKLRCGRRGPIGRSWLDVIGAKHQTRVSRHADQRTVQDHPPANLSVIRAYFMDSAYLDARSVAVGDLTDDLLPRGTDP